MKYRVHIIDGLLICIARIEEVIQTIKTSASTAEASARLQKEYLLDVDQAKAVLDLKLSRLAHLEVTKLNGEKNQLLEKISALEQILNNEVLFNNELIKGWKEVAAKFGDARRTQILNLNAEGEESIEEKVLVLNPTSLGNLFVTESTTLYAQKRGARGTKFKVEKNEILLPARTCKNTSKLIIFKSDGTYSRLDASELNIGEKNYLGENIVNILESQDEGYYIFITRNGYIKKTLASEYGTRGGKGINLEKGDNLLTAYWDNGTSDIGALSPDGYFIKVKGTEINSTGKISKGVRLTKERCLCARPIKKGQEEVCSININGEAKRCRLDEFSYSARGAKGVKLQENPVGFEVLDPSDIEILVNSNVAQICVSLNDIRVLSRLATGAKAIQLKGNEKIIGISKI